VVSSSVMCCDIMGSIDLGKPLVFVGSPTRASKAARSVTSATNSGGQGMTTFLGARRISFTGLTFCDTRKVDDAI
jgi:hypothetical protein